MRAFVLLALLLTGCVHSGIAVLAHPQTGQTVECREVLTADSGSASDASRSTSRPVSGSQVTAASPITLV